MKVYFDFSYEDITPFKIYNAEQGYLEDCAEVFDDAGETSYMEGWKEYTGPVPAGFILRNGGAWPVDQFARVDVYFAARNHDDICANDINWAHVIAYRIVEEKEVEKFEVKKGDYITGIQELTEKQYQKAVDAFVGAGAYKRGGISRSDNHDLLMFDRRDGELWVFQNEGTDGILRQITYEQLTGEPLPEKEEDCPKQGDWFSHQGMSDKQYEEAVRIFSSAGANIDLDYCVTDNRHGWTHTHWDVDGDLDQVIFDFIGKGGQEWFSDWPRLSEKEGVKSDSESPLPGVKEFQESCEDSRIGALSTQQGGTHYKDMPIQPIEFIVANNLEYRVGNVIKYACRHKTKNGAEDIRKAIHYLEMILETDYACGGSSTQEPT